MRKQFSGYAPDLDDFEHPGLTVADNVVSDVEGYKPITLTSTVTPTGNLTSVDDISLANLGSEPGFNQQMCAWLSGGTLQIGINGVLRPSNTPGYPLSWSGPMLTQGMQPINVVELNNQRFFTASAFGTTATFLPEQLFVTGYMQWLPSQGAPYTALAEPIGRVCGLINQFVFVGHLETPDDPFSVQWCAIGDPTNWPTPNTDAARAVQAGTQRFPLEFGFVTAIASNDFFGYIFQQRGITKATYVGGDVVFAFDTFEEERGSVGPVLQIDDMVFFESERGFHMLQNDQIIDIGFGKVDAQRPTLFNNSITSTREIVANTERCLVFFQQTGLVYNYKTGEWTKVPAYLAQKMFTINDPDATIGLARSDSSNNVELAVQVDGTPQEALLETGFYKFDQRQLVNGVRPLVTSGETEVRVCTKGLFNDPVQESPWQYVESRSGEAHFRQEGRYLKVKTRINDFETAIGFEADARPSGSL
ncbi:MAG: hypothetical protein AAF578_00315 [Pseudomonadota bacterium]